MNEHNTLRIALILRATEDRWLEVIVIPGNERRHSWGSFLPRNSWFFSSNIFFKIFFKGNDNVGYIPDAYFQPFTLLLVSWYYRSIIPTFMENTSKLECWCLWEGLHLSLWVINPSESASFLYISLFSVFCRSWSHITVLSWIPRVSRKCGSISRTPYQTSWQVWA